MTREQAKRLFSLFSIARTKFTSGSRLLATPTEYKKVIAHGLRCPLEYNYLASALAQPCIILVLGLYITYTYPVITYDSL